MTSKSSRSRRRRALMSDTDLPEFDELHPMDVLCGRGNAINKREGNVAFRKYVEDLKHAYAKAPRTEKVEIARRVVSLVHNSGGRFVRVKNEAHNSVYCEIGIERAVEKTCQALREDNPNPKKQPEAQKTKRKQEKEGKATRAKEKRKSECKMPAKKPSSDRNAKKTLSISQNRSSLWQVSDRRSSDAGIRYNNYDEGSYAGTDQPSVNYSSNSHQSFASGSDDDADVSLDNRRNLWQAKNSRKPSSQMGRPPTHRLMMSGSFPSSAVDASTEVSGWFCDYIDGLSEGSLETSSESWESNFRSLVAWKEVCGHCAIPPSAGIPNPDSSSEEKDNARLSDWSSVQRSVFRDINKGFREPTMEEKIRYRRLKALGFVFDYEEWHWDRKYEEAIKMQVEEGSLPSGRTNEDFSKRFGLALWIEEQRRLYTDGMNGKIQQMRPDRVKKLQRINMSWASNLLHRTPHRNKHTTGFALPKTPYPFNGIGSPSSSKPLPIVVSP